jgi:putative tricarboxylic transport membrane protein
VVLGGSSLLKALLSLLFGLWLTSIGTDLFTSQSRFTFGSSFLLGGIDFMIIAVGLFAIAGVLESIRGREENTPLPVPNRLRELMPSWAELKACRFAFLNGSVTGFIVGVLPGAGSAIASFIAYGVEKAVSRHPEKFGTGVPEGVAAPEGANNADSGGAMVPLLTLGIPGGGSTAILLSALVVWGVKPGPLMMTENPEVFWGLIASLYIGSVMLLVMNLPLVPLFAQILRIPVYVLFPLIFGLALVGAFGVSDNPMNLLLLAGFGLLGYVMAQFGFPPAPLILGFVLGDAMERAVRQSLTMSMGDPRILVERPLSAVMLALAAIVLISPLLGRLLRRRRAGVAA